MLIDMHAHVGTFGETTYDPGHLRAYLSQCDVRQVLVSNIDAAPPPHGRDLDEPDANLAVLHLAAECPAVLPVYWLRMGQLDSQRAVLAGALATEPFAGVLLAPALYDFAPDEDDLQPWVQIPARLGKPVFVLADEQATARPARIYEMARRHPRLSVVMITNGSDALWYEALDCLRRSQREQDSRLLLATSDASCDDILHAVEGVGADRLVFGSRAAAGGSEHGVQIRQILEVLQAKLTREAYEQICHANAARCLQDASQPARSA